MTVNTNAVAIFKWSELPDRQPKHALVENVDLVVVRDKDEIHVLYGRCAHRGALLADGYVEGPNIICGVHFWDFQFASGVSEYNNEESIAKFTAWVDTDQDAVMVDAAEIREWEKKHPQKYRRDEYLGQYADPTGAALDEPHNQYIQRLAREGLSVLGHHGPVSAMGAPLAELPRFDDIQILTAQLARFPLLDDDPVNTEVVIGPNAKKPLSLAIPIFVSDMSFGALSQEAKTALAMGAELAGTGICSGEGGMLPEEQTECSRYFYELASGRFGWSIDKVKNVQAFHFKAGQGAKTGTGGHLPGDKVKGRIAEVRGLEPGTEAISPSRFPDFTGVEDYQRIAAEVRETSGGIPIGIKMSAQHIEDDIDFALEAGVDYIILDGRGGGTGAAPNVFKNNISVPTVAALPRARRHLDRQGASGVSLIATGGLRTESDFLKALALGADAVAVSNSAMQAIGCLGMRACETNNCPVGIATQQEHLRQRLIVNASAQRLKNFFEASVELMCVMARACGHQSLSEFEFRDLTTFKKEISELTGVRFAGS